MAEENSERLVDTEEYKKSEMIESLILVQQNASLIKDAKNPYLKNDYISLKEILKKLKPLLAENNLFFSQQIFGDNNGVEYLNLKIFHKNGCVWDFGNYCIGSYQDPQKKGSALTYARRYQLQAALGLADSNDDDGFEASKPSSNSEIPFKSREEAIEWAVTKGFERNEAERKMEETEPDENGKKAKNYYNLICQYENEF